MSSIAKRSIYLDAHSVVDWWVHLTHQWNIIPPTSSTGFLTHYIYTLVPNLRLNISLISQERKQFLTELMDDLPGSAVGTDNTHSALMG